MTREELFETLAQLVALHSPSGVEGEVDDYLLGRLSTVAEPRMDEAGNIIVRFEGRDPTELVAIAAHKDEIGAMVKRVDDNGRLAVTKVGGSFPWVWGEGPVEVLGDHGRITGVLSFGARHVSDESPQQTQNEKTVQWKDAWVETMFEAEALAAAGVHAGTRVVPTSYRKRAVRVGPEGEYVASYAVDDKGAVAGLLDLAGRITQPPRCDVELVFTSREEIGCVGASYYARRTEATSIVALEVTPVAKEYGIALGADPVLIAADSYGPLHDALGRELAGAAVGAGLDLRHAVVSNFGSDASATLRAGNIARTACLAFATENTHGFEIAHLDGISNCVTVLHRWLS